jgi:hypothetical protein
LPVDRRADCVRFAVARDEAGRITLRYVYEREHAPLEHGQMAYDCATQRWLAPLEDACAQRQAECYLGTYLERKHSALSTQHSAISPATESKD